MEWKYNIEGIKEIIRDDDTSVTAKASGIMFILIETINNTDSCGGLEALVTDIAPLTTSENNIQPWELDNWLADFYDWADSEGVWIS